MNTLFEKALIGTILLVLLGQQVFWVTLHPVFAYKKKNSHHVFRHASDAQKQNFTLNWNALAVEVQDQIQIHTSPPPAPDLCVIITFPATTDPLKQQAHANTAQMYKSLFPRVRAFLSQPVPPEALDFDLTVLDAPSTNAYGTPLFASLVLLVEAACPDAPLLAYANSDILFDTGLLDTLDALLDWGQPEFMAVGRRRNHDLRGALTIHDVARVPSELFTEVGQDYFIFPRHLSANLSLLPPYVIGRRAYDNAINDWAFHQSFLVDLTDTVVALHQTTGDGNFAGHSDKNRDSEYNAELQNAEYDHGSTLHAQYATVRRDGRIVVLRREVNTVVSLKKMVTEPVSVPHSPPAPRAWRVNMSNPELACHLDYEDVTCEMISSVPGPSEAHLEWGEGLITQLQIPDGWPDGPAGPAFVRSNGDIILCQTSMVYGSAGCNPRGLLVSEECPADAPKTVDYLAVITQHWGDGYFHLVVEGLTRLAQAMHDHPDFFKTHSPIHLHSIHPQAAQYASLLKLGPVVSGDVLVTKSIISAPPTPCAGHRWSPHASWLRALLLPALPDLVPTPQPLVVKRMSSRSIINHDELVTVLRARVHTGQEPVLEQLKMFAESRLVVAPHGAGLANMVAMTTGTVVELQTRPTNHCYLFFTVNLGLDYCGYYEEGATHDGTWSVNIPRLLSTCISNNAALSNTRTKPVRPDCQWEFASYTPSQYETYWVNNIQSLQDNVCTESNKQKHEIDVWLQYIHDVNTGQNKLLPDPEVFSFFTFESQKCGSLKLFIEPLAGLTRSPLYCMDNSQVVSKEYLLISDSHKNASRAFLFDMGASLFNSGSGGPSQAWFEEQYGVKKGVRWDGIYAWEAQPLDASVVWQDIPDHLKPIYHWHNVPVTAGALEEPDNPLRVIMEITKPEDFVLVKLDIDNSEIENKLVQHILANEVLSSLIDEFFFEHHVNTQPMHMYWGNSMKETLSDTYDIFTRLRKKGVMAHPWV
jgi:hypothetical protein